MEFEVNGSNYRTGKLDAFKQLHVSRKIAPVMTKLLPAMLAGASLTEKADGSDVSPEELAAMMGSIQPLAQVYPRCRKPIAISCATPASALYRFSKATLGCRFGIRTLRHSCSSRST